MNKVSAVVYHEHGDPAAVLRVEEQELPDPGPYDVRVRISAAPINPADLNTIEGKYPVRPPLPAVGGGEGAGVIEAAGGNAGLEAGDHVLLPYGIGTWRDACVCPARGLFLAPREIPLDQLSMLKVNPATAWRMLHDFVELKAGDWFIQNAANSGVGQAAIAIAKELGYRSVNLVRRPELIPELESLGADVVLVDGEGLREQIRDRTGGAKIMLGLNAVGGESALHVANSLAEHGTHVTYGAMSMHPVRVPNGLLIFKDLRFRGFWVTKWYQEATDGAKQEMLDHLFSYAKRGIVKTKVEKAYPIQEAIQAIQHARQGARGGKIIFRPSGSPS